MAVNLSSFGKLLAPRFAAVGLSKVFGQECASSSQPSRNFSGLQADSLHKHPPPACYGGRHTVTLIPGDGIGPEFMNHVRDVFRHAHVPVDFEEFHLSGDPEAEETIENALIAVRRNGVALKGNIHTDLSELVPQKEKTKNVALRVNLDVFANIIHCKTIPGVKTRHDDVDIVIIRENTEGEYSSLEHENVSGVVESLKIITRQRSERIARYAFDFARQNGRKKVTAIHKANIMKLGDGLFLNTCREVAKSYPEIEFDDMIVDNTCMQIVSNPWQFDVMLLPNLYGNIVGNIAAGLVGGPGIVPGKNVGEDYAVFETATRNTGKNIAGKNMANPSAMFLASALMLDHIGLQQHAQVIRDATYKTISEKQIHTPDLGGLHTTRDVVQSVIDEIENTKHSVRL
ncbi:Isocitrate dehydrogenase [NAD] subunit gamma, mitochondrial [Holothuria leucospilota]|uniref:Isocitrate dehydrogenase [NAD] subunit, mitochondrial n=1 Tax=Holothuria leucospilota TaxID=206669 RepID=A0A9Q1HHZ0_HOLLE|nr:Isocitrate dehydrogenase [NAD] subunit gamma, mitochondrial [Holothuria leucospilota]